MSEPLIRSSEVVTPEHVKLQFQTAGIGSRSAALLLDYLVIAAIYAAIGLFAGLVYILAGQTFAEWSGSYAITVLIIVSFVMKFGYFTIGEYYGRGQTYGKQWMGLRVVQENGQPVTLLSSLIRNFFRIIDGMPSAYLIGALCVFFHPKDKRIGDLAASTIVVRDKERERRTERRKVERWLHKRGTGILHFELTEAQRRLVERDDWLLISGFIGRAPSLSPERHGELASQIAPRLAEKLGLDRMLYINMEPQFIAALYLQLADEWSLY